MVVLAPGPVVGSGRVSAKGADADAHCHVKDSWAGRNGAGGGGGGRVRLPGPAIRYKTSPTIRSSGVLIIPRHHS